MTRTHRITVLVGAAALVAACSSGPSTIDGEAIADAIDDTIDDADFDDDTVADVDCPVDDWDDIVEDTLRDFDDDVVELALDGDRDETAFIDDLAESIDCSYFNSDADVGAGAGLFMLEAPRDVDEYTEEFAAAGEDDADVDIDPTTEYRGGQFRHVCVQFEDEPEFGYCQVEWVDDDLLIGIYVTGDGGDRIDTDDLEEAFTPQLDLIAEQFDG